MGGDRLLQRARRRGDLPVSAASIRAAGLLAALACLPSCVRAAWLQASAQLQQVLRDQAAAEDAVAAVLRSLPELASALPRAILLPLLPLLAAVGSAALVVGLVQSRGSLLSVPGRTSGGGRAWSASLAVVSSGVLLAVVVARIALDLPAWGEAPDSDVLAPTGGAARLLARFQELGWTCAAVLLVLGALDAWWVQRAWQRRHTLDAQELRREARQREINPEARAAQRRAHGELSA